MTSTGNPPFGRVLTAMVTPFEADGSLDVEGASRLASHLIDLGNDGLVISGTTGESPTTTDAEKDLLLRTVVEAVGHRAQIVAGVGTSDTRHSVELARAAEKAGAHGLLVVSPYYSKPPQSGLEYHVTTIADATGLPVMLYDIPGRTGIPFATETLVRLAAHDRVVAVKDAKADLEASSRVISRTDLAWYSGDDVLTLPFLSIGAVGVVSVIGHLFADRIATMVAAYRAGRVEEARDLHLSMVPAYQGFFRTQGVITTKAALNRQGLPGGPVRPPLMNATDSEVSMLRADLATAGLVLA